MKNILVTCAFPYSNGLLHLGHLLEHIQADIWVRFNKMIGNNVYFLCSDDSHGTAIILESKKLGILPEDIISNMYFKHKNQFKKFDIFHDFYFTTNSRINYFYSLLLLNNFYLKKLLKKKVINQYFDEKKNIFLPDRLLRGICPKCYKKNQYGDFCENCNSIYNSYELINPVSYLSNTVPVLRKSQHLFVNINIFKKEIYKWICISFLQDEIRNQLIKWLNFKFDFWNISRDYPYFGFKISNKYIKNKYFYVWWDALLGYISTFRYFCNKNGFVFFNDFWKKNSNFEIYHFIGKDILYFHGIIWPIMLDMLNFRKPSGLIVHGHVLLNGIKMSKSLNNFVSIDKWLECFDSDSLRYYFSTKLSYKINDINLCLSDFIKTINSDFVNKFINIASRIYFFINKYFNNFLSKEIWNFNFYNFFVSKSNLISNYFLNFDYYKVIFEINIFFDILNKCINKEKPWNMSLNFERNKLHNFCTTILNIFRVISIYLLPIVPNTCSKIEKFLNCKLIWKNLNKLILNHRISNYNILYKRLDKSLIYSF